MNPEEQLQALKSNLLLIKSMTGEKAEDQFYNLMEKAKKAFGEDHLYMAEFYFQYAKFIIEKLEKNVDIFNAQQLPQEQVQEALEEFMEIIDEDTSELNYQDNNEAGAIQPQVQDNQQNLQKNNQTDNNQPIITQQQIINNVPAKVQQAPNSNAIIVDSTQKQVQGEGEGGEEPEDDDFQIAGTNLVWAIKLFQNQKSRLQNAEIETSVYSLEQIMKFLSRCRSRLGDLYQLNQSYQAAIQMYNKVVEDQEKKEGHQKNRGLAEIHYMIANSYLYENKECCQQKAIKQFIKSVNILLNHLQNLNPMDQTSYQRPTEQVVKVDRYSYLPKSTDSSQTKQIKEVISCLLDKLEDTYEQIPIRKQYQQVKNKKEEQPTNKFSQVKQNTPTVNLGTFGNRKKKPEVDKEKQGEK